MKTRVGSIVLECHTGRNGCGSATYDERGRRVITVVGARVKTRLCGTVKTLKSWILLGR